MFKMLVYLFILLLSFAGHSNGQSKMIPKILPKSMRAVGLYKHLPITHAESLLDLKVNLPILRNTDVLIQVKAIAVNPIDAKLRAPKTATPDRKFPRILGWDGAGVIAAKGDDSEHFNIGDEVYFTGDLRRNGTNAEYVAFDEVMVGIKPKNLTFEEAAALPLTAVTAYESLYDRLLLSEKDAGKSILIINSGGGVGSVATQLAKNLGLIVIGTASRSETEAFSLEHGADIVLNHTKELLPQLKDKGFDHVDFILVNYDPVPYWDTMMTAIKPQGRICLIVDSSSPVDIRGLKDKSVTLVSEMMTTRIKYETEDKYRYREILQDISKMLEVGRLKSTLTKTLSPINAANLKEAHRLLEQNKTIGKIVLSGF